MSVSAKSTIQKSETLKLYKNLLSGSKKFHSFNFRTYFIRRTKEEFRKNKDITDQAKIQELIKKAKENNEVIQRQALINSLYATDDLVLNRAKNAE